jgi:hypothetical protein
MQTLTYEQTPTETRHPRVSLVALIGVVGISAVITLFVPCPILAADGKFFFGLDFASNHIGADDPQAGDPANSVYVDENGAGVTLYGGFSISQNFKLRLHFSGARHETSQPDVEVRLASGTLEVLYMFSPQSAMRPYFLGGFGGYTLESEKEAFHYKTDGPGMVFGGGFYYFLGRNFAFNFSLRGEWVNWDKVTAELVLPDGSRVSTQTPIEESGFAGKFTAGASVWF